MSDSINVGGTRYDLCGFCRTKITDDHLVGLIKSVPYHALCKGEYLAGLKGAEQKPSKDPKSDSKMSAIEAASSYRGIDFEPRAYRAPNEQNKALMTFDESLERLRAAGFQRHARPQEAFGRIIDGLEGKLSDVAGLVAADMTAGSGEWLSLACERRGDTLIWYLDPTGLFWTRKGYEKRDFHYAEECASQIKGMRSGGWLRIDEFSFDFIRFICGRAYGQLPAELRAVYRMTASFMIPQDGDVRPVMRGDLKYDINDCHNLGASRGVRKAPRFEVISDAEAATIIGGPGKKKGWLGRMFGW